MMNIRGWVPVAALGIISVECFAVENHTFPVLPVQVANTSGETVALSYRTNAPILNRNSVTLNEDLPVSITLQANSANTLDVGGQALAPGETILINHDFAASAGYLEFDYHPVQPVAAGTANFDIMITTPYPSTTRLDIRHPISRSMT